MKLGCAFIAALALLGARAEASTIIFTDRDAFNAVVQPNARVGFGEPGHVFCNPSEGCPPDLTFDDGLFRFVADFFTLSTES